VHRQETINTSVPYQMGISLILTTFFVDTKEKQILFIVFDKNKLAKMMLIFTNRYLINLSMVFVRVKYA